MVQYYYHFNQGQRCTFSTRCRFNHICRGCGSKHQASNCFNNKSALLVQGKTIIKLDRIIKHTKNYPDYHFFFNACRYARFHITICWPKITQVLKKILIRDKKYLVAKILFSRVAGPFLHPSFPTVSPFGFVLKKDDDFRLIPYLFLSSNIYRIRKHRLSIYVASKNKKIKLNAYA